MDNIQALENGEGVTGSTMPGYIELVKMSVRNSLTSWPLFLLLTGSAAVASVAGYLLEVGTSEGDFETLTLMVVSFVAILVNLVLVVVAVKYYLNNKTGEIGEYLRVVFGSVWSYLWVIILSSLVTIPGFILFIIPGLILSIYLVFALHARVAESVTGMNALVRSSELVRGYWFVVTLRLIVLTLSVFVGTLLLGFVIVALMAMTGVSEENIDRLSFVLIEPVLGSLGTMIHIYALTVLYKVLVAMKAGTVPEPSSLRGWYIGLAVLTPFVMLGLFVLVSMFYVEFAQI